MQLPELASGPCGESPPPAPGTCFGRDELIEEIVGFAENLTPIALIGAGGIGKTSLALAVLHHHRIKQRFGENRRFIRCDQFPATVTHLLNRLSKVIGACFRNPKDLASLYPFLPSMEMFIVLDNAEYILDPRGTDATNIYALVEELNRMETICLCITSLVSAVPPECEAINVPNLSMKAAQDVFYSIYKKREQPNLIGSILEQLDFHALSITLLATVAYQNGWGTDQLTREWERRRTSVLQTEHDKSLATTIELSLASPLFQDLGPDARELLGVVAFFPQGVDENNIEWLFPAISNGADIFEGFCTLSLTYRSNGFITMLAPLRDYLSPTNPESSSLLCTTKECYFTRMSTDIHPDMPNFGETRWIISEDVNVEHLLDVFTTIDTNSGDIWGACINFMNHLVWHKTRFTILKPKIEGLPDDHLYKPLCLLILSQLFNSAEDQVERKRLLVHALKLQKEQEDDLLVGIMLVELSETDLHMDFPGEGIQQAEEASEIFERLGDTTQQAGSLISLACLLHSNQQFDAAEEAASRAINLIPENGQQFRVCRSHRVLGNIYRSKGEIAKAIHHYEAALGTPSSLNWHDHLFWVHCDLTGLFYDEGRLDDAQTHIEHAKSHTVNNPYRLGYAMRVQVAIWCGQHRLEEARAEALHAADIYETFGAAEELEVCRQILRDIEEELNAPVASGQSGFDCELLVIPLPTCIDCSF